MAFKKKENRDKILRKRLNLIKFVKNDDHISISALIFTICFLRFLTSGCTNVHITPRGKTYPL